MIGHKDFPSRSGGVEVVVYELATRLAKEGEEIILYNRVREQKKMECNVPGVASRYVYAPEKDGLNALIGSFTATISALLKKDIDVFHYHAIGPCVPIFIPHIFGKKTVATVHGLNWQCSKWGRFASLYLKFGEKMAAKYADEIIVLSEKMQKYFKDTYNRETALIKNAVVPIEYTPCRIISERFGLDKKDYILFLARVTPEKGIHYLISAYKKAKLKQKLVIAGDLPDSDYCRGILAMAKDCENIVFTGFAELDVVKELYSNCALYVLPSETEGLAITLLEAMSSGAKCVTSDIPENSVVLKDFGRTFVSKDENSLADALRLSLSEPIHERAEEQAEYIRKNYSYDEMIKKHRDVYARITGIRNPEELKV